MLTLGGMRAAMVLLAEQMARSQAAIERGMMMAQALRAPSHHDTGREVRSHRRVKGSRYMPHQGAREIARRKRQALNSEVRISWVDDAEFYDATVVGHVRRCRARRKIERALLRQLGREDFSWYFPEGLPAAQHLWKRKSREQDEAGALLEDYCLEGDPGSYPVTAIWGEPGGWE